MSLGRKAATASRRARWTSVSVVSAMWERSPAWDRRLCARISSKCMRPARAERPLLRLLCGKLDVARKFDFGLLLSTAP